MPGFREQYQRAEMGRKVSSLRCVLARGKGWRSRPVLPWGAVTCQDAGESRHAGGGPTAVQLATSSVGETQHRKEAIIQGISPYLLFPELVIGSEVSHPEHEIPAYVWEQSENRTRTATVKLCISHPRRGHLPFLRLCTAGFRMPST